MSVDKKINYKNIKGQKHMLAYITPGEAKTLEKLGGQKTITPEGIPAYPPGMGDPNYDGGGGGTYGGSGGNKGREAGAVANQTQSTPDTTTAPPGTRHNPNLESGSSPVSTPDTTTTTTPNISIHGGPAYKTGFGTVPGVTYNTGLETQRLKNIELNNQLLNTPYSFKSKIPTVNFLGNTLGRLAYNVNTKFFSDKNIGAKINPETGEPFGYGIDGYNDYMRQRQLGNVGAYGGTELSQNAINARAAQGDSTQGIMDVYNNPGDGEGGSALPDDPDDTNEDGSLILRFLHDNPQEVVNLQAMGVKDTDEMLQVMLDRAKNLYTT